ncbi:hypothetical protein C6988_08435 [Nitrosopumilus sp. b1]|uniref:hypothetical protein n=1 Tax=Nitrosopumilus sp. b1 TaxID=2109907 RepID=UPI0015F3ABFF|nr:hypothetical protein [Nitrosopumilus sp. b1]KAF6242416.1 hypothetical protein C6988_08435 [Nitrosopumilus sp. b1]
MKSIMNAKLFSALTLLLVLAIAPISSSAFAQTSVEGDVEVSTGNTDVSVSATAEVDDEQDNTTDETDETDESERDERKEDRKEIRDERKEDRKEIRDERRDQIKDFREQVAERYQERIRNSVDADIRPQVVDPNRPADLTFEGKTSGYMLFGNIAWGSQIHLTDGVAHHASGDMWRVKTHGVISIDDSRTAKIDMSGYAKGNRILLNGSGELDNGEKVRLFLRGHFAPTNEYGVFALAFTQAGVHNINTGEKIPLMHVGEVIVTPTTDVAPDVLGDAIPVPTDLG